MEDIQSTSYRWGSRIITGDETWDLGWEQYRSLQTYRAKMIYDYSLLSGSSAIPTGSEPFDEKKFKDGGQRGSVYRLGLAMEYGKSEFTRPDTQRFSEWLKDLHSFRKSDPSGTSDAESKKMRVADRIMKNDLSDEIIVACMKAADERLNSTMLAGQVPVTSQDSTTSEEGRQQNSQRGSDQRDFEQRFQAEREHIQRVSGQQRAARALVQRSRATDERVEILASRLYKRVFAEADE